MDQVDVRFLKCNIYSPLQGLTSHFGTPRLRNASIVQFISSLSDPLSWT